MPASLLSALAALCEAAWIAAYFIALDSSRKAKS